MNVRIILLSLGAFSCIPALSQSPDPPGAVGRTVHVEGPVLVQGDASAAPESLEPNWPLIPGDRIHTGRHGRTELTVGPARIWIDQESVLTIAELSADSARLRVHAGTVHFRQTGMLCPSPIGINAAGATVDLIKPGEYRVEVQETRTTVAVLAGEAQVATDLSRFHQFGGEEVLIAPDGSVNIREATSPTALDRWSARRSQRQRSGASERHVPRGLVGYEELDDHGLWAWEPAYGMVWEPRSIHPGWAPYRFGHWIWKSPWGWTWIDDASWGFATTHYGRWTRIDGRWKWAPGARQLEAIFAPALVEWLEDREGGELIGWFPLEAREEFVPPYPASAAYRRKINTFTFVSGRKPPSGSSFDARPREVTWTRRSAFAGREPPAESNKHLAGEPAPLNR